MLAGLALENFRPSDDDLELLRGSLDADRLRSLTLPPVALRHSLKIAACMHKLT